MNEISKNDLQLCACMGPQGDEPYCPCEMSRMGLESTAGRWTEEQIEQLKQACKKMYDKKYDKFQVTDRGQTDG